MIALIKKGISTIKNDGLSVFTTRLLNYSLVKYKRFTRPVDHVNIKKFKLLHNKFSGNRIFIIGNGPSLNSTPLYLFKNEYTMCFNRFNLMLDRLDWEPTIFGVTDDLVIKDMFDEINTEILPRTKYAFFPDIHPSNVDVKNLIDNRENVYWINTDIPAFSDNLPQCGINKTVVNAGIQFAAYLGFKEIYLIGVDVTFGDQKVKKINKRNWEASEHDPNHFDPRYFEKGRKYHNPTVHEMIEKFAEAKTFFDKRNVKIYNAGIGGKLEVFPRVDFYSLFNHISIPETQELLLFKKVRDKNINYQDLHLSPLIDASQDTYPNIFKTDIAFGLSILPKLVYTYFPLGPYQNSYYFVKK